VKPDYNFGPVTTNLLDGWTRQDRRNHRAVVFVHGFIGDPLKTWQEPEATQAFPELLVEDPKLDDFDCFRFKYKTNPFSGPRIKNIAQQLENEIRRSLADYQVVLLAHSMGGLVCMQYIVGLLAKGARLPVIGLLMFGTPTTGVEWVNIAKIVLALGEFELVPLWLRKLFAGNSQYEELAVASQFLQDLQGQWILHVVNGGYAETPASQRASIPVRVVTGNEDWVVKEYSAKGVYGEIDWNPLQLDHRALVKPSDRKSASYQCAADFLVGCRSTYQPEVLAELRRAADKVWSLRKTKLIRNWNLEIRFDATLASPIPALKRGRFASCEVSCRYTLVLSDRPFVLGLTLGGDEARSAWKTDKTDSFVLAYLHQIFLDTIPTGERQAVAETLGGLLARGEEVWASLFGNLRMRIAAAGTAAWHDLVAGEVKGGDGHLLRTFRLPEVARPLVGEEVTLDLGFRSIRPTALHEFTLQFPWLTLGFDALVVIESATDNVFATSQLFGQVRAAIESEDQGKGKKIRISSEGDLVLPESTVRIRWVRAQKEEEMNGIGKKGAAKKGAAKKAAKKAPPKKKAVKKTVKKAVAKKAPAKKAPAK
jgi:pimeloyl-ACP methyl ester carboxylesterase